jgi:imidazolonepropionase-like amidohydrolase
MNMLRWQLGLLVCLTLMTGCMPLQTQVATGAPLAVTPSPPIASPMPVATRVAPPSTSEPQPTTTATPDGAGTLALVNGTLMDGTGAAPLADAVVVIRDKRIVGVGTRAAVTIPSGAQIIDVQGATILPGLINTHVHRGYSEQNLQTWAQAGVTTVRDLGTSPAPDTFAIRDALIQDPRNARLVAAGPMLTVQGGYPMVPWGMQGLVIASEQDAIVKVNQLLDDGADVIKIALESGSTFKRQIPVLSKAEAAAIVKTAHARGTRVSAHVTAAEDLERVLDAGVDDIAHMPYDHVSDELIARIVKARLHWIPTLELWQHVGVSDAPILDNLRRFVAAGGQVALGTDYAGYAAQFELGMPLSEMEAMQKAGMTPMQIILAGTRNAAVVCSLDRELGSLEVGKVADVLVVKGNPLQDLRALASVRLVIHNGAVIRQ